MAADEEWSMGAGDGNILIAFFHWGGNTRGMAEKIQAQHDQNIQASPELSNYVEDFEQYDTILLGYPKMERRVQKPD